MGTGRQEIVDTGALDVSVESTDAAITHRLQRQRVLNLEDLIRSIDVSAPFLSAVEAPGCRDTVETRAHRSTRSWPIDARAVFPEA